MALLCVCVCVYVCVKGTHPKLNIEPTTATIYQHHTWIGGFKCIESLYCVGFSLQSCFGHAYLVSYMVIIDLWPLYFRF